MSKNPSKDYYGILGVSKTANLDEIKKAYRNLAIKFHPDKTGGSSEKFCEIQEAYDILSNEEKRSLYDRFGTADRNARSQADMEDIFSNIFGGGAFGGGAFGGGGFSNVFSSFGGRQKASGFSDFSDFFTQGNDDSHYNSNESQAKEKSSPLKKDITITLEDVYNGKDFSISVDRQRVCDVCNGAGSERVKCKFCGGSGVTTSVINFMGAQLVQKGRCNHCSGTGKVLNANSKCKGCIQKGLSPIQNQKKIISLKIEKGIPDKHQIILKGEGHQEPNKDPGDIIITINIEKHPLFVRKDNNLHFIKELSLVSALCGTCFEIPYFGSKINIEIKKNEIIAPGTSKEINNFGMPFLGNNTKKGKLIIDFNIVFPKKLNLTDENINILKTILN